MTVGQKEIVKPYCIPNITQEILLKHHGAPINEILHTCDSKPSKLPVPWFSWIETQIFLLDIITDLSIPPQYPNGMEMTKKTITSINKKHSPNA